MTLMRLITIKYLNRLTALILIYEMFEMFTAYGQHLLFCDKYAYLFPVCYIIKLYEYNIVINP
jgi:hypothetical protein